jgi:hypothetical protein
MHISFEFINNLILLNAVFHSEKGSKKLKLLLDTGSDTSLIFSSYSKTEFGTIEIKDCLDKTSYKAKHKFRIIENTNNLSYQSETFAFDGILGQDFLENSCTIDFVNKTISKETLNIAHQIIHLPSLFYDKFILLEAIIQNKKINLLFDTACSEDLIIFERTSSKFESIKTRLLECKDQNIETLFGAFNNQSIIDLDQKANVAIGKLKSCLGIKVLLENEMTTNLPAQFEGIIGNNFFRKNNIRIDFNLKRVSITPPNN